MSFELPNLDTATFMELQAQLVRRIPQFTTQWTDYNPSDPGITLIQLLSWLGESLMYQANAIPIETRENILRWVLGLPSSDTPWPYAEAAARQYDFAFLELQAVLARIERGNRLSAEDLQRAVLLFLQAPYLALTLDDVGQLALQTNRMIDQQQAAKPSPEPPARVRRADAVVSDEAIVVHILSDAAWTYTRPGPGNSSTAGPDGLWHSLLMLQPSADPDARARMNALLASVTTFLAPRVLLGSAVRAAPARLTDINLTALIRCPTQVRPELVLDAVSSTLFAYFQPTTGGIRGVGWAHGQAPDPQEVLHLIGGVPGVAAVESFAMTHVPTVRLPDMARLGVNALLADLPPGPPAMIYDGLPRLRCLDLSAGRAAP